MAESFNGFHQQLQQKRLYLELQAKTVACCVQVTQVDKIFPLMALTQVSGTPGYLAGVFNYHGITVPVIDLAMRLGETVDAPYTANTQVLVCILEEKLRLGLIVSGIGNVIAIGHADLQLAPQFPGKSSPFSAVYQQRRQSRFVLNASAILDSSLTELFSLKPAEVAGLVRNDSRPD